MTGSHPPMHPAATGVKAKHKNEGCIAEFCL